jgi:hypothetical protein
MGKTMGTAPLVNICKKAILKKLRDCFFSDVQNAIIMGNRKREVLK